jgi:hypothetical protein
MLKDAIMPAREGVWLVYTTSILTTRRQGAVSKDVTAYFEALGYMLERSTPSMEFSRGSVLRGMTSSSPASQKTEITVDVIGGSQAGETVVEVKMRVGTFGTWSFQTDHDFREAELYGLQVALEYGYIDQKLSQFAADRAKYYSMMVALMGIAVLAGVAAGFLLLWLLH